MSDSEDSREEPEERLLCPKRGGKKSSWVDPLYACQPEIFWDRKSVVTRDWFVEKYGLCNRGITPKQIKIGHHLEEADVESLFGPRQNGNGYRYSTMDEDFVRKVETMWMICHQKTVVPNTRMVNVSEAKGFAYEIVKKKETNWALFAEWTCRDQLKKLRAEDEEAAKFKGTSLKGDVESDKDCQLGKENRAAEEVPGSGINCAGIRTRQIHKNSLAAKISMAIGEWQLCLETLERESLGLDGYVQVLFGEKEEARMTLHKVSSQVEYGRKLISDAQSKLSELEAERDDLRAKLTSFRPEDGGLQIIQRDLEGLQLRLDAQKGMLKVFEDTCGGGQAEIVELAKLTAAEEAWTNAKTRQHLWKRHRLAFQTQLRGMRAGYERPTTTPAPLPCIHNDWREQTVDTDTIHVGVCPFCLRGFQPAWDCRLASCRHAYHSWCALTHFSESTKCIHPDCAQEMHTDWWICTGIPKDGLEAPGAWERAPLAHLGQTSRTISGVDKHREPAPSRTPSPSMGSFQDLAGKRPRQDHPEATKVTPPAPTQPHSTRMAPPANRAVTTPHLQVPVVQHDSVIPETEPDAISDEVQFRERRTKSRNDVQWEERIACGEEEVNGRLKRKKGHLRVQPHEREVRINGPEVDGSQKRKMTPGSSRRGPQAQAPSDFGGDNPEFSTDEDDDGGGSEDDFQDTPPMSQIDFRAKDSHIDRFLRGESDDDDRKISAPTKHSKLIQANRRSISMRTRSSQRNRP